jgi:hypothetical protein
MVRRISALLLIALAASGCRFLVASNGKLEISSRQFTLEEIDAEIARVNEEKARGKTDVQPDWKFNFYGRTGIGQLYELRSLCQVHHSRVFSFSALMGWMGIELWRGGASEKISTVFIFVFAEPLLLAVDVVQLPIQLGVKTVKHLSASKAELDSALLDLARARSQGLTDPEAPMMDWPLRAPLHLDTIGYKLPPVKIK